MQHEYRGPAANTKSRTIDSAWWGQKWRASLDGFLVMTRSSPVFWHSVEDILYAFRFPLCMSSHLLKVGSKQLNSRTCVGLQSFKPNGEFRAIAWCQWTQSLQWSWRLPKTLCLLAVHSSFVDLWQAFRPFGHASFGGWDCSWHSGGTSCRELGSRNWCFDFARWTGAGYLAVMSTYSWHARCNLGDKRVWTFLLLHVLR